MFLSTYVRLGPTRVLRPLLSTVVWPVCSSSLCDHRFLRKDGRDKRDHEYPLCTLGGLKWKETVSEKRERHLMQPRNDETQIPRTRVPRRGINNGRNEAYTSRELTSN